MRSLLCSLVLAVLGLAGLPSGADAAYQMLALVATDGAVPLACVRGDCYAQFTTFCLQPARGSPPRGAPYTPIGGEGITLVGATKDGRTIRFAADERLRIHAARGHNAVRMSIAVEEIRALGLRRVAIAVGEHVSLVPKPVVGDKNPLSEAEIARVTGPLRALGARIVDHGGERTVAARLTNDLINGLPELWQVEADVYGKLWRNVGEDWARRGVGAEAERLAREAFDDCRAMRANGTMQTMRECLGSMHDQLIGERNDAYWEALRLGS